MDLRERGIGERKLRVGISGSYGGINLGDEAILQVILAELRRALPIEVTVFSRDAEDTVRRHRADQAVQLRTRSARDVREILAGLDLLILGGGGILYDRDAEMFLREVFLAAEVGTPVMVYAVGAGPLVARRARALVRDGLNQAAVITVRDRRSQRLLEEIGVEREIVVTADPAVLVEPEPLTADELARAEGLKVGSRLVAFSVREPGPAAPERVHQQDKRLLANAADFVIERLDADVVFVPLERRNRDVQHSHGVVGQMRHAGRATVLRGEYTPGQCVSLLENFALTVGMRLHFLIFSALAGVPFVALPYAAKVSGFLEELEFPWPVSPKAGVGELVAHVDRAWDERESLRARIQAGVAELKRRALANNAFAVQLLSRERVSREEPVRRRAGPWSEGDLIQITEAK